MKGNNNLENGICSSVLYPLCIWKHLCFFTFVPNWPKQYCQFTHTEIFYNGKKNHQLLTLRSHGDTEQYFQAMATNLILLKSHENCIVSPHTCQHFRSNSFRTYRIHRIQSYDWLPRKRLHHNVDKMFSECGDTEKFHKKIIFCCRQQATSKKIKSI